MSERKMGRREAYLVGKAVEREMRKIESGEIKTYTHDEVKKKLELQ